MLKLECIAILCFGALLLLASIFNWDWMFTRKSLEYQGNSKRLSLPWIHEKFGRKIARIVAGVLGSLLVIMSYEIYFRYCYNPFQNNF